MGRSAWTRFVRLYGLAAMALLVSAPAALGVTVNTVHVSTSATVGGTITPTYRDVTSGLAAYFTLKPTYGYSASVAGCDGLSTGPLTTSIRYRTGAISSPCNVDATFAPLPLNLTITTKPMVVSKPFTSNAKAGVLSFAVTGATTQADLDASAVTSQPWITKISVAYNGRGKGTLKYTVAANESSIARNGTITIADQTFTIYQAGKPIKLTLAPTSSTPVDASGGYVNATVTVDPSDGQWSVIGKKWTPVSSADWIAGLPEGMVTGASTLALVAGENATGRPRSVVITMQSADGKSKKTFTVKQNKPAATTPLKVADKVSVVDAKTEVTAGKVPVRLAGVWSDAGTEYDRDKPSIYVQERAAESFNTVNEILCMMGQTRYEQMVNKGAYKALVNQKQCSGNDAASNSTSSQQGGTSASNAPDYMEWTVRVTRASNSQPQVLEAWIHEAAREFEPEKLIQAKAMITEGTSEENPYGIFTMNFIAYPSTYGVVTSSTPLFKGVLRAQKDESGKVLLKFAESDVLGGGEGAVALEKNGAAGGGKASRHNQGENLDILFSYNADLFHRKNAVDNTNEVCLDRNNYETSAWRYGMYDDATGRRVSVNSGFPISTQPNGNGSHGWVGYWGLWVPEGTLINNGDQVYKQNYNGSSSEAYTVVKVGGKLKKHTRKEATLSAIKNIPLETNDMATGNMIRVIWTDSGLRKIAEATPSMGGPTVWNEINQTFSTGDLPWGELNFWSQALGGQVRIPLQNCTMASQGHTSCDPPTGSTNIVYYVENIVYPGDAVPANLTCFDNCPSINAGNVSGSPMGQSAAENYTFDSASDLVLKKNGTALVQTGSGGQDWGFNSGPLFDSALIADPASSPLKCDWTGMMGEAMICGWKAWSVLEEFYTWETGKQNWNQLTVLMGADNTVLKFDPPLRVEYTHSQTNPLKPDYKYNGTKFFLDYNGFGELQGIPGKCVDMNTGETVTNCNEQTRWVPEFSIPAGSTASYAKDGETHATRIKPLEMEQRMVVLDNQACSALTFGTYTLPTVSGGTIEGWTDPSLGGEPVITAAPAVIAGEVKVQ